MARKPFNHDGPFLYNFGYGFLTMSNEENNQWTTDGGVRYGAFLTQDGLYVILSMDRVTVGVGL